MIKIGTGVQFKIPDGYYGQIYPRSSMAKVGLRTEGGVIDASYRGEVQLMLSNKTQNEQFTSTQEITSHK